MPRIVRAGTGILTLALALVGGCATAGSQHRGTSRYDDLVHLRDSLMQVVEAGQNEPAANEPRVRIITPAILGADRYVESAFRVDEDAYVAIVAVDNDGFAHVVFPESPSESGFVRANTLYVPPSFFAGFGSERLSFFRYGWTRTSLSGFGPATGLIFAVASNRPLQLQRLATDDGDWDDYAIERVLWGSSYNSGSYALGRVLTLTGQEFDTDFSGFTQGQGRPSYMFASLDAPMCQPDDRSLYEQYYAPAPQTGITNVQIDGIQYVRIAVADGCGGPLLYRLVPLQRVPITPVNPVDSTAKDSSSTDSGTRIARAPHVGTPVESGSSSFVEPPVARGGTIGRTGGDRESGSFRRPMIDRALRLAPPVGVREEGRIRGPQGESLQEEMLRERQARRASEERGRRNEQQRQRESASERPTQSAPTRSEPAAVERTSSTPVSAGGGTERTGKPIKE